VMLEGRAAELRALPAAVVLARGTLGRLLGIMLAYGSERLHHVADWEEPEHREHDEQVAHGSAERSSGTANVLPTLRHGRQSVTRRR